NVVNPDQADVDADGIGDVCDLDLNPIAALDGHNASQQDSDIPGYRWKLSAEHFEPICGPTPPGIFCGECAEEGQFCSTDSECGGTPGSCSYHLPIPDPFPRDRGTCVFTSTIGPHIEFVANDPPPASGFECCAWEAKCASGCTNNACLDQRVCGEAGGG